MNNWVIGGVILAIAAYIYHVYSKPKIISPQNGPYFGRDVNDNVGYRGGLVTPSAIGFDSSAKMEIR